MPEGRGAYLAAKELLLADTTPPIRLHLRGSREAKTERLALRATLADSHLLGLATGTHLRVLRGLKDPLAEVQARLEEAELRARLAWEAVDVLSSRFAKIPERYRPYYHPVARFRILELNKRRLALAHTHYLLFRPHQGLGGATPAEAYLGFEPANARAESPPRGRLEERLPHPALRLEYLDPPTRSFPILNTAA